MLVDISEVAENIYMIDDQLLSIPKWGSVYLVNEEKKALIDTGPTSSKDTVLEAIKRIGVKPEDIDYIIATHIHLDHSGGAGALIREMPEAQVLVHHRGAKHLVNPAKLVGSATEVQGGAVVADFGDVVPVSIERVKPVYDGDSLELSKGQVLKFIDAPGHAPHELCIYESRNNGVFVGDAAGIQVGDDEVFQPGTTPPNFDLELNIATLEKLVELNPSIIYFAHFGAADRAREVLFVAIDKLKVWGDIVDEAVRENMVDSVEDKLMAQARAELKVIKEKSLYKFLTEVHIPLCIAGYKKYYEDKHKVKNN